MSGPGNIMDAGYIIKPTWLHSIYILRRGVAFVHARCVYIGCRALTIINQHCVLLFLARTAAKIQMRDRSHKARETSLYLILQDLRKSLPFLAAQSSFANTRICTKSHKRAAVNLYCKYHIYEWGDIIFICVPALSLVGILGVTHNIVVIIQ
jgi:hypothetical protein